MGKKVTLYNNDFPTTSYSGRFQEGKRNTATPRSSVFSNAGVFVSFPIIITIGVFVIAGLIFYIVFLSNKNGGSGGGSGGGGASFSTIPNTTIVEIGGHSSPDKFNDPYYPPLKNDGVFFPIDTGDLRGVPSSSLMNIGSSTIFGGSGGATGGAGLNGVVGIGGGGGGGGNRSINMQTRGFSPEFTQMGILTRETGNSKYKNNIEIIDNDPKILPLMGRRVMNGRDKYQYYTISNSGNVNTKLPIRKEGRNCINEYGCDPLYNGDIVFVEGYGDKFKATIYENEIFRYIP
jgi:hypothetical protein